MNALQIKTQLSTRQQCILEHCTLVNAVASRLLRRLPSSVVGDDLIRVGMIGLIEAYDRFDSTKGVPFSAYAELRIRGAMIDELRKLDWVPRSVRKRAERLEQVRSSLKEKLKRPPELTELAEGMGMTLEALSDYIHNAKIRRLISFDAPCGEQDGSRLYDLVKSDCVGSDQLLEQAEIKRLVNQEITELDDRSRQSIEMYYFESATLKEIGQQLRHQSCLPIRTAAISQSVGVYRLL